MFIKFGISYVNTDYISSILKDKMPDGSYIIVIHLREYEKITVVFTEEKYRDEEFEKLFAEINKEK